MLNLLNLNLFLNVRCLSLVNPKLSFTTSKNECSILFGVYNNKIFLQKLSKFQKKIILNLMAIFLIIFHQILFNGFQFPVG